jgi:hypothetical protein
MFQTKVVEETETHILYSVRFFEIRTVFEMMWKNISKAGKNTDDNMALAHFTLGTSGYKYTFSECVILIASYYNEACTFAPQW